MTMNFAEFQQTRKTVYQSSDSEFEELYSGNISGFKYADCAYLACNDDGSFMVVIANWCEQDRDLTKMEKILWSMWYLHEQENVILSVNDTTLDDYLVGWCDYRGIECDGDLYGVLFSRRDTYTLDDVDDMLREHHTKKAFGHSAVFGEKRGND